MIRLKNAGGTIPGDIALYRDGIKTRAGSLPYSAIASVELVDASSEQKTGGWVGRTVVGAVLLGPLGALIGAGTRKKSTKNSAFIVLNFATGHQFFTETTPEIYRKLHTRIAVARQEVEAAALPPLVAPRAPRAPREPRTIPPALAGILRVLKVAFTGAVIFIGILFAIFVITHQ